MNLDNKLKEILDVAGSYSGTPNDWAEYREKYLSQIKQAFEEDGWIEPQTAKYGVTRQALAFEGYMTGQEWYDRFDKAMDDAPQTPDNAYSWSVIDEAARKASGIK